MQDRDELTGETTLFSRTKPAENKEASADDDDVREYQSGEGGARLPAVTVTEDDEDDDGIFMSWPEPDKSDTSSSEDDGEQDDSDEENEDDPDSDDEEENEDGDTFIFRRAAESDREESGGKKKRKKKKRDAQADNEAVLSSMKYYKHTKKVKELLLRRVLPLVLIVCFAAAFVLYFFRLQHLTLDNLEGYEAEDIFRATGIKRNMFIFSVNSFDLRRKLAMDFPYIQDVDVELDLPDTVHLIFTEDCALFYTKIYDEYFVISQSMRVLGRYTDEADIPKDLKCISLPAVSYAVVGYDLQFFDTSYLDFLSEFLDKIGDYSFYPHIDALDLSNRSYLSMSYEDRLTIDLGSSEDIDTKLLFVKSIIESLRAEDEGTITLIDNKKATFSPVSIAGMTY